MLRWIGDSKGIEYAGAPARDLSDEEAALYGGEEALIATGCYVRVVEKAGRGSKENKAVAPAQENKDEGLAASDMQEEGSPPA